MSALWLQVGLPNKPAALVMFGYRQWQLPGPVEGSGTVPAQLERWLVILEQWERALQEKRQTICMMDANIDFLTWTREDLPSHQSSDRLRPLIQALFTRILPHGVSQLVTCATRAERGVPITGLDHLYTNCPDKLSEVTAEFTGMSDHKIVAVRKFSKDMKRTESYTTKRIFKDSKQIISRQQFIVCRNCRIALLPHVLALLPISSQMELPEYWTQWRRFEQYRTERTMYHIYLQRPTTCSLQPGQPRKGRLAQGDQKTGENTDR